MPHMAGRLNTWLAGQNLGDQWQPQYIAPLVDLMATRDEGGNFKAVSTQRDGGQVLAHAPKFTATDIVLNQQAL